MGRKFNNKRKSKTGKGVAGGKSVGFNESRGPEIADKATNNPAWYSPSGQIVKDVASLAYGYPTGGKQSLGSYTPELNKYGTPGIMSLFFTPTFGASVDFLSPLNIAARDMYSFVRHANSGHANYDAPDLMLYCLAIDQVYMWLAHIRRLYGCLRTHSYQNKYYAYGLTRAAGGDYDDLITHMSELRAFINVAYARAGAFAVPKTLNIMDRHQQICSYVYADSADEKAQLYLLRPRTVYKYAYDSDGAGGLTEIWGVQTSTHQDTYVGVTLDGGAYDRPQGLISLTANGPSDCPHAASSTADIFWEYSGNYLTYAQIVDITNQLLTQLEGVEDVGIISGDILKAYGPGNLWGFTELTENEVIVPKFDPAMLMQIQNASLMGYFVSNPLVQDADKKFLQQNTVCRTPYRNGSGANKKYFAPNAFLADRYLNVDLREVTPEDTMEATRLMNIGTYYEATSGEYTVDTCGSEIVEFAVIYRYDYSQPKARLWASRAIFTSLCNLFVFNDSIDVRTFVSQYCAFTEFHNTMNLLSNFEFHPAVYNTQVLTTSGQTPTIEGYSTFDSVAFDLNKYTIVGAKELSDMSNAAIQALLGIGVK